MLKENSLSLHEFVHAQLKSISQIIFFLNLKYLFSFFLDSTLKLKRPTNFFFKITNKRILEIHCSGRILSDMALAEAILDNKINFIANSSKKN